MQILEPPHDEEYEIEEDSLELERPQRIPVPPVMLWGALCLVSVSLTVAAVATLLLPEQLNPVLRSKSSQPADELAQFDESQDQEPRSQPSTDDPITAESAEPNEAVPAPEPSPRTSPTTEPDVAIAPNAESPAADAGLPLRLMLLVTVGCGLLSGGITLVLRNLARNTNFVLPQPKMPNARLQQRRNARQRSRTNEAMALQAQSPQPEPSVMVLPPEAVTPLDEFLEEEGGDLAAQLDIRRRYSLSSLIDEELE